jgi:hypothetical protein
MVDVESKLKFKLKNHQGERHAGNQHLWMGVFKQKDWASL